MTDEQKKAWEEWIVSTKRIVAARNYDTPTERAILAVDAELKRLCEEWDIQRAQIECLRSRAEKAEAALKAMSPPCPRRKVNLNKSVVGMREG